LLAGRSFGFAAVLGIGPDLTAASTARSNRAQEAASVSESEKSLPVMPELSREAFDSVCLAIGRLIVLWSHIDVAMSSCVREIYHGAGGRSIEPQIPRAWKRRVVFIRKCLNKIDALREFKQEEEFVLNRLERVATLRDFLCHGAITSFPKDENDIFVLRKLVDRI